MAASMTYWERDLLGADDRVKQSGFLINDENAPIVDVSKRAFPDAPPEAQGPVYLVCPHCGHDERDHSGPHEMFDLLDEVVSCPPLVSSRHFRCRECHESSPVWVIRRDGTVTTHMRDAETEEACMPQGFHGLAGEGKSSPEAEEA